MTLASPPEETRPSAQIIPWPSIAAASAQLRWRRRLQAVSTCAGNPAVPGRVTPLRRPTQDGSPRR